MERGWDLSEIGMGSGCDSKRRQSLKMRPQGESLSRISEAGHARQPSLNRSDRLWPVR